ncbi:MAG: hypothetical protein V1736_12435 [Pseudomonadota bacterium]
MIYVFDHNPGYLLNESVSRFTGCRIYEPSISLSGSDLLLYCKYFHNYTRFKLLNGETDYEQISRNKNEEGIDEPIALNTDLNSVLRQQNSFLFLCNTWEYFPLHSSQFQHNLSQFLLYLGIPSDKVIISCCDSRNIGRTVKGRIKAFGFDWSYLREKINFSDENSAGTSGKKQKRFIFLNRRYSDDRFLIFLYLMYKNYDDRGHLSFLSEPPPGSLSRIDRLIGSMDFFDSDFPGAVQFMRAGRFKLPVEIDGGREDVDWAGNRSIRHQISDSHFFIINETICDHNDFLFVSEKTYKGIRHGMPFLLFGSNGILKHLRKLGFRTFHPFIDESYDEEEDYLRRLNLFIREIDRLCRLNEDEIKELHESMIPIVDHNTGHLKKAGRIDLLENEITRCVR